MGSGVLIYAESIRDGSLPVEWRARVTVHEIGHNFGLGHTGSTNTAEGGIMFPWADPAFGPAATNYFFIPVDADAIRRIPRPN